tara:strand:+ start:240 stop:1673 length:1434 start_codon:yes stop_codon:yes gene_type:complete
MSKLPNQFLTKWINLLVFVFCISVLAFNRHGGEAAIILLFTMVYLFITKNDDRPAYKLNGNEIIFISLVILYWLVNLLSVFLQPEGLEYESTRRAIKAMDNMMRWLLMLPIFFLFRRYKLNWRGISIGLSIGVFITVGIAIYEVHFLGVERASGGINQAIAFGEIMVVVDLLLWVFMIIALDKNEKLLAAFLLISSLVAFYGSLLSLTRGAWLAYVFLMLGFILYTVKRSLFNKKYIFSKPILLRIFFAFIVFFAVSQTEQFKVIEERTVVTVTQASQGEYDSASGDRMAIFRTAIDIFRHYPFGVGTNNFQTGANAIIILHAIDNENVEVRNQDNEVLNKADLKSNMKKYSYLQSYNNGCYFCPGDGSIEFTSKFEHAHNEWLNVLAENGVAGIILLTLLFVFPIKIFWQNLNHENSLVGAYSFCGILLVVSYAIFGQSQAIFSSHVVLIFFIFFLFLFIAQISRLSNIDDKNDSA